MAKKKSKKAAKKSSKKVSKKASKKSSRGGAKKAAKKTPKKAIKKAAKKAPQKAAAPTPKPSISINPYLTFPGNCEEAFNFYHSVFGGKFGYVGRFGEMPPSPDGQQVPDSEKNKIMHISLPIGHGGSILMGSDSSEAFGHATVIGNNFSISVTATNDAEADKIYHGLAAGGHATMPMGHTFWGSYFGMLTDKFGIQWMVSHDKPQNK